MVIGYKVRVQMVMIHDHPTPEVKEQEVLLDQSQLTYTIVPNSYSLAEAKYYEAAEALLGERLKRREGDEGEPLFGSRILALVRAIKRMWKGRH